MGVHPPDDFGGGWDNRVSLVDGWVHRTARFPDREAQLRREATLLPWLSPQLPLPVPMPEVVAEEPFTVRYPYLPGSRCGPGSAAQGAQVGAFLRALHNVDPDEAVHRGALDATTWHAGRVASLDRMRAEVVPLLPRALRSSGAALLDRLAHPPSEPRLVHGDLGPEHVRVSGDQVTGVIDWGDSGVGDPAVDLAWTAYGAGPTFVAALVSAYGPTAELLARGRDLHLVGPWHEVLYGLGDGGPSYVESGLTGVVARLSASDVGP